MRTGSHPYRDKPSPRQRFAQAVGDPRDATGLYAAMRRYVEYRAVMGSTELGLYSTERYLRDFIAWCDERSVTHPQHVSRAVLERYQRWLYHYRKSDGGPLSIASQRCKLVPLRGWFKWLTRSGAIPANPAADLDLPRSIRRLPRSVLTAAEMETVLALPDTSTPLGLRDRALMEVLYATGMRRMEATRLELGDVDAERCVVLIREGKGRKDRLLPLGERALHWVQQYLARGRPALAWNLHEPRLFLGNEGNPLHPMWLSTVVGRYIERAELGKRGGPHLIRHTMATLMLEGGADVRFIQAMLGHAEMSTTQIYTQVAIRQLQLVHASTHPGAKRRARASQAGPDVPAPHPDPESAAEALLQALADEAEEDEGGELTSGA
ncbi:site-specific tyrosine recombinase XerC [Roseateles sp. DB2]|uniref:site-specific tyrosine recombinase XerC n=1 Tax=Roseateles sp. DB2 TaxID=3453717 RepID=UPI003EEE63DB